MQRFSIAVIAIGCPLMVLAIWMFGAYGTLIIALVPVVFAFRYPRHSEPSRNDRNA